jgi:hypothetical protein
MDFESLVPILFVTVWILSVIFGRKKAAEKKDSPLRGIFGKFIKQIKTELEQKASQGKGNSVWEMLAGDKAGHPELVLPFPPDGDSDSLAEPAIDSKSATRRPPAPPPIPTPQMGPSIIGSKTLTARQENQGKAPAGRINGRSANRLRGTDLEKAVIWSEILAPPVAFRNDHLSGRWR